MKETLLSELVGYRGIYKIENIINGIIYVGQSENIIERWCGHVTNLRGKKGTNTYLQKDFNKYGLENFRASILELCDKKESLLYRELAWIIDLDKKGYPLYNAIRVIRISDHEPCTKVLGQYFEVKKVGYDRQIDLLRPVTGKFRNLTEIAYSLCQNV